MLRCTLLTAGLAMARISAARQLAPVDEFTFPGLGDFIRMTNFIGNSGLRSTASPRHYSMVSWIENELLGIPGLEVRGEAYDILRWKTVDDKNLDEAARLTIEVDGLNSSILLAGAIPYSLPTSVSAPLIYVPPGTNITSQDIAGKIVLRDFPNGPLPYSLVFALAYHKSADLQTSINDTYDRPSFANEALHQDMLDAGNARAAGIISMFDVPRQQIQSYFEPHFGTHYALPGAFVGIDEALALKRAASNNGTGSLGVTAEVGHASTRNVFATLPGISDERIILNCHTDGNTWVQDNGIAALLALAKYFAEQPKENRNKTLEFAFTTGHLHISKEGAARYADQLDREYDDGTIALVIAIEHMGTNEIVPQNRTNGLEGRELVFTGKGELMLWSIGPIPTIVNASWEAVQKRRLDRTIVTQGAAVPNLNVVPPVSSFGGIGTYFHRNLIPTTSLISGPWSLWAPSFGPLAIDLPRLRSQTLALADVVVAADALSRETLAGGYLEYRAQRAANASLWNSNDILPEVAPNVTLPKL